MITQPHYIAIPKSGSGPGVVILHSWWGLNNFFKGLCDRFAEAGFVAVAPDLYDGKVAATVEAAKTLRAQATASRREPVYKTLMAAINSVSRHNAVMTPKVAVIGFSMGGHWALWPFPAARTPHCGYSGFLCGPEWRFHAQQFTISFSFRRKRPVGVCCQHKKAQEKH